MKNIHGIGVHQHNIYKKEMTYIKVVITYGLQDSSCIVKENAIQDQ